MIDAVSYAFGNESGYHIEHQYQEWWYIYYVGCARRRCSVILQMRVHWNSLHVYDALLWVADLSYMWWLKVAQTHVMNDMMWAVENNSVTSETTSVIYQRWVSHLVQHQCTMRDSVKLRDQTVVQCVRSFKLTYGDCWRKSTVESVVFGKRVSNKLVAMPSPLNDQVW